MLEPFKGERGFPQVRSEIRYPSLKKGVENVRLLFPLADRGDLFCLIKSAKLTAVEKEVLSKKLIQALFVLEEKRILHRDLKVENILVRGSGRHIEPIIADFGLSTEESNEKEKEHFVGTFCCMSPEYMDAAKTDLPEEIAKATTRACDVWAIGVILDEMINGLERQFSPPAGKNKASAARRIAQHIEKSEPTNKHSIEHFIWSALRKNPADRIELSQVERNYRVLLNKKT